jgi:hypothetical protein
MHHMTMYGPAFAGDSDLAVRDHCQNANVNYSNLGVSYANDTGIAGTQVLTGSERYTVKEIEVFQVT